MGVALVASELTNWMEGVGGIATAAAFIVAALTLYFTERTNKADAHGRAASVLRQEMRSVLQAARTLQTEAARDDPLLSFSVCLGAEIKRHLPATTSLSAAVERLATDDHLRRRLIMAATDEAAAFQRVRTTMEQLEHADLALRGRLRIISTSVRLLVKASSYVYSVDGLFHIYSQDQLESELAGGTLSAASDTLAAGGEKLDEFIEQRARVRSKALVEPIVIEVVDLIRESYNALVALGDADLVRVSLAENPEAEAAPTFTEEISVRLSDLQSDLAPSAHERLTREVAEVEAIFKRSEILAEAFPSVEASPEENARILTELTTFPPREEAQTALARLESLSSLGTMQLLQLVDDEVKCRQPDARFAPGIYLTTEEAEDVVERGLAAVYLPERRDPSDRLLYHLTPEGRKVGSLLAASDPLPDYLSAAESLVALRSESAG